MKATARVTLNAIKAAMIASNLPIEYVDVHTTNDGQEEIINIQTTIDGDEAVVYSLGDTPYGVRYHFI